MQHFKIRQGGFQEIKKQMLIRVIPLMAIAGTAGITISVINSKSKTDDVNVLPIVIPVVAVMIFFGLYSGIKRQKALFDSYQLTLTDNLITREQLNTPTVSIYLNDISEIIKNKNRSLSVRGKDATDIIIIPAQIENYATLESALVQKRPIAVKSTKPFLQRYGVAVSIFNVVLMLCVYTVTNKVIVAISGTIVIAILSWSLYEIRRSKNIDAKTKRSKWWVVIVLASIIAVMVIKLIGIPISQ